MNSKALGKGLSALIPEKDEEIEKNESVALVEVARIENNRYQPRKDYDDDKLDELKLSIQENGILQPILIRPRGNSFEVVAGERRLRAARALALQEVPAVIKEISDKEAMVMALVENIQREELNPIEEAIAFKRLIEEFEYTQETVAKSVGKDRSTVTNLLRLLKLPNDIQKYVSTGKISMGHARALLSLSSSVEQQVLAQTIIVKGLSVRELEREVKKSTEPKQDREVIKPPRDRDIVSLEEELQRVLGTKVRIKNKNKKGQIVIDYYSLKDLDRLIEVFKK